MPGMLHALADDRRVEQHVPRTGDYHCEHVPGRELDSQWLRRSRRSMAEGSRTKRAESRNTEMRERAREKRLENPARPIPQGDLAGKAAGCPLPAVPLCCAVRGMIVPDPLPFQSSASPRTRAPGNGSSGSHRSIFTIYKSPPRPDNTRVVPRSARTRQSPRNGFASIQIRRGNSSTNVSANTEAVVHVNNRTVPVDTERKQR